MPVHVRLFLLLLLLAANLVQGAERTNLEVEVADPYLELHTGPGRGYPVFHVVDRGERVEILKRKTDWFKVRTPRGKEGWVARHQMELTLTGDGRPLQLRDAAITDFASRRWELGALGGDFGGARLLSIYGGFAFSPHLTAELSASHALGDFSDNVILSGNLVALPFPDWRVSPFFTLGTGAIYTRPKATLVEEQDRIDQLGHVGLGIRLYLTRRFIFRAEYRSQVIFQSKDDNQEINEWKAGFGVFF